MHKQYSGNIINIREIQTFVVYKNCVQFTNPYRLEFCKHFIVKVSLIILGEPNDTAVHSLNHWKNEQFIALTIGKNLFNRIAI